MLKKGGTTIKVIDNNTSVTIFCDDNLEELKELDKDNLYRVEGNENFAVSTAVRINALKASGCTTTERVTDNRDRVKIDLSWERKNEKFGIQPGIVPEARFELRPYKRTLGIWYWCSRTVSYSAKAICSYFSVNTGKYENLFVNCSSSGVSSSHIYKEFPAPWMPEGGFGTIMEFTATNCWGTSASVNGSAELKCNTGDIKF